MTSHADNAVQTVLGPVAAGDLGITLPHEHLVIDFAALWEAPGRDSDLALSLGAFDASRRAVVNFAPNLILDAIGNPVAHVLPDELAAYAALGGKTLVEVTPIGVGRHPRLLAALSRLTGLNIVMATAFYVAPFHPPFLHLADAEAIAGLFVRELTEGVGETGIRAGIIGEIGTGSPVTTDELKVVRAAALAHAETGVSINLHRTSYPGGDEALAALDLLIDLGVAPDRIVMSHCDERPDPGFALEVARRGAYVEMDTWGMEMWAARWVYDDREIPAATDSDRLRILAALLEAGHIDQVLLSQDVCNKAQLEAHGGYGYGHLLRSVRDRLRLLGVTPAEQARLFEANPQRMLAPRREGG